MPREGRLGSTGNWLGRRAAALLAALWLTPSCAESDPDSVELEVYNWWLKPSETRAFEEVKSAHEQAHPNVTIAIQPNADATRARAVITDALLLGDPYSTFQANLGADLLRWTMVEVWTPKGTRLPQNYLHPLDDLFERLDLEAKLWDDLLEPLRSGIERHFYAVPINVHRLNLIYYNIERADDWAAAHGQELFDIDTLCPNPIPDPEFDHGFRIAVGIADQFVLTLLTFENILPALAGPVFYEQLFKGTPPDGWEDEVRRALECTQYLSRYFTDSSPNLTWDEAAFEVANANSDATFTVMGDWVNGELTNQLGTVVDSVPFPDSDPERRIFVYTSDTFPLPVQAPHRAEIAELLETIADRRTQEEFSREKGSIPALKDAQPSGPRAAATREAFETATHRVLATSGLNPTGFPQATRDGLANAGLEGLEGYLRALVRKSNPDPNAIDNAIALLRDALPMLHDWQELRTTEASTPVSTP